MAQRFKASATNRRGYGRSDFYFPVIVDRQYGQEMTYERPPWAEDWDSLQARTEFRSLTEAEALEQAEKVIVWLEERGPKKVTQIVQRIVDVEVTVDAYFHYDARAIAKSMADNFDDSEFSLVGYRVRDLNSRFMDVDRDMDRA